MAERAAAPQHAAQKQPANTIGTRTGAQCATTRRLPVRRLMRSVGNAAVNRLLRAPIQAKLTVGPADDEYEREANRVADEVMRMPDPAAPELQRSPLVVQRTCAACEEERLQRTCAECEEERLQRHPVESSTRMDVPDVSPSLASYLAASRGGGDPLPPAARAFFEPRFGREFGHVRVHTDSRAAEASNEIRARAFTTGPDIYFARGQYSPGSTTGDRLLGHELTHVVQQGHHGAMTQLRRKKSSVGEEYSRGNDDQYECCYETAAIKVTLELDDATCNENKDAKVPTSVVYVAVLGGKTEEAGGGSPTQSTTEGTQHFLEEMGRPKNKVPLTGASATGSDPGTILSARIDVQNDTTCAGSKQDTGCVLVNGPRGVQQQIEWTAAGRLAKKIEAVQLAQKAEQGTNRLAGGLPLLPRGGYPSFADAQPRHKDCWCEPKSGYHLPYLDGPACPKKYRGLPADFEKTKKRKRPKKDALPKVCDTKATKAPICDE